MAVGRSDSVYLNLELFSSSKIEQGTEVTVSKFDKKFFFFCGQIITMPITILHLPLDLLTLSFIFGGQSKYTPKLTKPFTEKIVKYENGILLFL